MHTRWKDVGKDVPYRGGRVGVGERTGVAPAARQRVFTGDQIVSAVGLRKSAHGLERACACTCACAWRGVGGRQGGGGWVLLTHPTRLLWFETLTHPDVPVSTAASHVAPHVYAHRHTLTADSIIRRRGKALLLTCPVVDFEALPQPIQRMEVHPPHPVCNGCSHGHRPTGGEPGRNTARARHSSTAQHTH